MRRGTLPRLRSLTVPAGQSRHAAAIAPAAAGVAVIRPALLVMGLLIRAGFWIDLLGLILIPLALAVFL
ncbi:MAG: hypothetical protein H7A18_01980 [Sinobacteraceae bacterium]|nr:hypothetical protein [Nevskiaceae bacterium]MCP5339254.1 hypothetical protein [Nevskiaceae bacterium]MCP5359397.1 hypothetical protein [Nevskiaceae bacterium]MCP5467332.1 hypothetical protein [Nevskiaceae bacterium]MCP5470836.1 hypothetical protein [Nevskiaceae bacterium]